MIVKIFFVIPSLRAGGAERVMSFLAENLSHDKFKVTLIVIGHQKDQAYSVDTKMVDVVFLGKDKVSQAFLPMFRQVKKLKPDIVLSSIGHLNILMSFMAPLRPRTAFVAREANIDKVRKKFSAKKKGLRRINLKKIGYRFLKTIICQSNDMYEGFTGEFPQFKSKTVVINNPITDGFTLKEKKNETGIFAFITVGALHGRKGHDRILKALSRFPHPFTYTIVGNGEKKQEIFDMAKSLGIFEKIQHIPYTNEVPKYLAKNDFYLQGSYVEGFPNAVIESCAVGTPVLAFDAPGGINEIIDENVNGSVSKSEDEFLESLIHHTTTNTFNPEQVRESVLKKYGKEIILKKYEDLFFKFI
ncbi:glycosyltransferase [Flagellimonas sp.]|jgi:glycosyltransferase involved in cell wall biosynthesis|uniref:glycosyltransferase n=1 Tax=Flagellimonas sp. TaxID=2058762 RepID=UPI003BA864E1